MAWQFIFIKKKSPWRPLNNTLCLPTLSFCLSLRAFDYKLIIPEFRTGRIIKPNG
jgi:hypothetical protein